MTVKGCHAMDVVEQSRRKCVICGKTYAYCSCKCTWCKKPLWEYDEFTKSWSHHSCRKAGR